MKKIFLITILLGLSIAQQRQAPRTDQNTNSNSMRDLDYEVVKLSYIQTDRALAILKTMGYTVVEYRQGKGEISGENNFTPMFSNKVDNLNAPGVLPIIIKIPDTQTISLVEQSKSKSSSKKSALGIDLGGVTLDKTTSGEPMQRLLVGYNSSNMRPLAQLLDLISNKIDVPASQVAIEALVIDKCKGVLPSEFLTFTFAPPLEINIFCKMPPHLSLQFSVVLVMIQRKFV